MLANATKNSYNVTGDEMNLTPVKPTPAMSQGFREDKAVQATSFLVDAAGGKVELAVLLRVMYYAEQASLLETLRPIFYGAYFANEDGVSHQDLRDLVQRKAGGSLWLDTFEVADKFVYQKAAMHLKVLSRAEKSRLAQAYEALGSLQFKDVIDYLAKHVPEWKYAHSDQPYFGPLEVLLAHNVEHSEEIAADITSEIRFSAKYGRRSAS